MTVNSEQRSSARPSIGRPSPQIVEQPLSARKVGRPFNSSDSIDQFSSARTSVEQAQSARTAATGSSGPTTSAQQNQVEQPQSARHKIGIRSSDSAEEPNQPMSARSRIGGRSFSSADSIEQTPSARTTAPNLSVRSRSSLRSFNSADAPDQPPSARSISPSLSSRHIQEQPSSARSTMTNRIFQSNPSSMKAVPMVPASVSLSLRPLSSANPSETPAEIRRDRRYLELYIIIGNFLTECFSFSSSSLVLN